MCIYIISQLLMPLRGFGKIGSWAAWKKPKNKIYGFFIFKKKHDNIIIYGGICYVYIYTYHYTSTII